MELIIQIRSVWLVLLFFLSLQLSSITAEENKEEGQEHVQEQQKQEEQKQEEQKQEEQKQEEQKHEEQKHDEHQHDENDGSRPDPLKFAKDVGHIREHLKDQYGFNDEQADQYLKEYDAQTQFFVMHDYDNNTKLDGLELLKSMTHYHDDHEDASHHDGEKSDRDNADTLIEFVDMILKDQDYNNDGYIDYPEYISYYSKFDQNKPPAAEGSPPPHTSL